MICSRNVAKCACTWRGNVSEESSSKRCWFSSGAHFCFFRTLSQILLSTIDHNEIVYVETDQTYAFLCVPSKNPNSTVSHCVILGKELLSTVSMVDKRRSDWRFQTRRIEAVSTELQRSVRVSSKSISTIDMSCSFSERDSLIIACTDTQPSAFEFTTETGQAVFMLYKAHKSYDRAVLSCKTFIEKVKANILPSGTYDVPAMLKGHEIANVTYTQSRLIRFVDAIREQRREVDERWKVCFCCFLLPFRSYSFFSFFYR